MSWPTVAPSDIEARWRPLTTAETAVATTRIKDVEAELRSQLRLNVITGTPTGIPTEEIEDWEQQYVGIVAGAVKTLMQTTEGWSEERVQIDDYSHSWRREAADAVDELLTDDMIARLLPRIRPRRGAFSIRLGQS